MKTKLIFVLVVLFTISACTQLGGTRFKRSYVSIKDANDKTVGTLFVWEADASAAVLFEDGEACMQTALAIKTANIQAEAKLSDAILNLSETASSIAAQAATDGQAPASAGDLAKVTTTIQEAASMLTTTTERTAFLNIGMFYICQIAANKSINEAQANTLINTLVTSSAGMQSYNNASKPDSQ
ncbi:MAG: hypothetical protein R3332_05700 [Pseudohongiellaceae bacterium]|nr:hypothetical protein [Pseudohongiellaceae bacterium]